VQEYISTPELKSSYIDLGITSIWFPRMIQLHNRLNASLLLAFQLQLYGGKQSEYRGWLLEQKCEIRLMLFNCINQYDETV